MQKVTTSSVTNSILSNQGLQDIIGYYSDYLTDLGYSQGTIDIRRTVFRKFIKFVQEIDLKRISGINQDIVKKFILYVSQSYQAGSMGTVFSSMRSFLGFLYEKGFIFQDIRSAVPVDFKRKSSIIPVITQTEEDKLIEALDTSSIKGKRDYAILLLALRLGLRSIDIIQLKVTQINWRNQTIEIDQHKTGRHLTLPLLAEVGNALMDYILNGRPSCLEPHIFLRIRAPYTKLADSSSVYSIISSLMRKADIRQQKNDRKGAHCLRHTLASKLLNAEIPVSIISDVLGHRDKDTTKGYLSIDLNHLRACALDLRGIEVTVKGV